MSEPTAETTAAATETTPAETKTTATTTTTETTTAETTTAETAARGTKKRAASGEPERKRKRKRRSGWDQTPTVAPPAEASGLTEHSLLALEAAKQIGLTPIVRPPSDPMCRIYVGSLHFTLDETDIRNAFETFGTITKLDMSKEPTTGRSKGYCFIEFEQPSAASLAIQTMNGFEIAGREIKVGRPHHQTGGVPMPTPVLANGQMPMFAANPMQAAGGLANAQMQMYAANPMQAAAAAHAMQSIQRTTSVPAAQRIYVGSVGWDSTAYDVAAVFSTFGAIRRITLMPNPETGKHKGFGFIEFEQQAAAENALSSTIAIAGRQVKTGRAAAASLVNPNMFPPQYYLENIPATTPGSQLVVPQQGFMPTTNFQQPSQIAAQMPESLTDDRMAISGSQRQQLMERLARGNEQGSRVVLLRDMVGPGEVDGRLEGEITEECSKFGVVDRVVIFQDQLAGGAVKIFVAFQSASNAEKCRGVMHGRWFGGRIIQSALYPQDQFDAANYAL